MTDEATEPTGDDIADETTAAEETATDRADGPPRFQQWPESMLMDPNISTRARIAVARMHLRGVGKEMHKPTDGDGVKYAFRGIEEVSTSVSDAFDAVGLFLRFDEEVVHRGEVMRGSKPWAHVIMEVTWWVCSAAGSEQDFRIGKILGEGMDNSDKVHQKALTGSNKDALVKFLTISADGEFEAEAHQIPDKDTGQPFTEAPPVADMTIENAKGYILEQIALDSGHEEATLGDKDLAMKFWREFIGDRKGPFVPTSIGDLAKNIPSWREHQTVELNRDLTTADDPDTQNGHHAATEAPSGPAPDPDGESTPAPDPAPHEAPDPPDVSPVAGRNGDRALTAKLQVTMQTAEHLGIDTDEIIESVKAMGGATCRQNLIGQMLDSRGNADTLRLRWCDFMIRQAIEAEQARTGETDPEAGAE